MTGGLRRSIHRIETQFDEIESLAPLAAQHDERVSHWSIGNHLDHLIKVDRSVLRCFDEPAAEPMPPLSVAGWLILTTGWIPRGRAQAPQAVQPEARSPEALAAELPAVRDLLATALASEERLADPRAIARHPVFGGLSAARWVRFIVVHHSHHLKIARDVRRATSG